MHAFNRAYLWVAALLPLVLPFIKLSETTAQNLPTFGLRLPEVTVTPWQEAPAQGGSVFMIIAAIYTIVSALLLARYIRNVYRLRSVISKSNKEAGEGYTLAMNSGYGPGSWGKYILLPGADKNDVVINHEIAHIRLHHTVDIMLLNALQVFFWPNLFLVWLKKELVQVHEFQADAAVQTDERSYAELLLSNIFNTCTLPSTHSFIIHPIKRRIMMLRKRSAFIPRIVTLVATVSVFALVVTGIIGIQSCQSKSWEVKEEAPLADNMTKDGVYKYAEKMPEYPGGQEAMANFLASKIVYPKEAREKKVEGKVFVEFVIDENGKVISPKVKKSPDALLSASALAAIREMPDWIPGEEGGKRVSVLFTLPVSYQL